MKKIIICALLIFSNLSQAQNTQPGQFWRYNNTVICGLTQDLFDYLKYEYQEKVIAQAMVNTGEKLTIWNGKNSSSVVLTTRDGEASCVMAGGMNLTYKFD